MFTGIIREIGEIKKIAKDGENLVVEINCKKTLDGLKEGDSVSIDGICSTATKINEGMFTVCYMPETIKRTTVSFWKTGEKVNLEPAMQLSDKINGHLVSGHVDCVSTVKNITKSGKNLDIDINLPEEIKKFTAFKGSIAIDGISLTVSFLEKDYFSVSLIPHTIKNTTLGNKKIGDKVNLEIDMIARYLKRLFDERDEQATYEFLQERGFI